MDCEKEAAAVDEDDRGLEAVKATAPPQPTLKREAPRTPRIPSADVQHLRGDRTCIINLESTVDPCCFSNQLHEDSRCPRGDCAIAFASNSLRKDNMVRLWNYSRAKALTQNKICASTHPSAWTAVTPRRSCCMIEEAALYSMYPKVSLRSKRV